jgi:hypothetical protein
MMMEQPLEEKPKEQKSKKVYTTRTKLIHLAIGFVGQLVIMTIVSLMYATLSGPGALILIFCLPAYVVVQIVLTVILFWLRPWVGVGVVTAFVVTLGASSFLSIVQFYLAISL